MDKVLVDKVVEMVLKNTVWANAVDRKVADGDERRPSCPSWMANATEAQVDFSGP